MTIISIFTDSTRQPGTYRSPVVTIPDISFFTLFFKNFSLANEPVDTVIEWSVDRSDDGGQTWHNMIHAVMQGGGGIPFYKEPNIGCSVNGVVGQLATGYMTINKQLKFGVDGELT